MLVRAGVLALGTVLGFQQFPPFKGAVDLLEVDARVFDREGVFVTDLRIDDFEVVEDGVPQKIQTMFLVDGRRVAANSTTRSIPRSPQTWIFVFDQHHLTMGSYVRARNAVREFLTARFRSGDLVGLVSDNRMVTSVYSSLGSTGWGSAVPVHGASTPAFT